MGPLLSGTGFIHLFRLHNPPSQARPQGSVKNATLHLINSPFAANPHGSTQSPPLQMTVVGAYHSLHMVQRMTTLRMQCGVTAYMSKEQMDVQSNQQELHAAGRSSTPEVQQSVRNPLNISRTRSNLTNRIRGTPDEGHYLQCSPQRGGNFLVPKKSGGTRPILDMSCFVIT